MITERARRRAKEAHTEVGRILAMALEVRGLGLRQAEKLTGIPKSTLSRYFQGSAIRHDDGMILEELLGLPKGRLAPRYREWSKARKGAR